MKELCASELMVTAGGDCRANFVLAGVGIGSLVGGTIGYVGGFGLGVVPGLQAGSSAGGAIGNFMAAYYCFH